MAVHDDGVLRAELSRLEHARASSHARWTIHDASRVGAGRAATSTYRAGDKFAWTWGDARSGRSSSGREKPRRRGPERRCRILPYGKREVKWGCSHKRNVLWVSLLVTDPVPTDRHTSRGTDTVTPEPVRSGQEVSKRFFRRATTNGYASYWVEMRWGPDTSCVKLDGWETREVRLDVVRGAHEPTGPLAHGKARIFFTG